MSDGFGPAVGLSRRVWLGAAEEAGIHLALLLGLWSKVAKDAGGHVSGGNGL